VHELAQQERFVFTGEHGTVKPVLRPAPKRSSYSIGPDGVAVVEAISYQRAQVTRPTSRAIRIAGGIF
jgi:hypothetical protein